jgi:hypothetical protein
VSTTTSYAQPALIGGLVMGVLTALPIISAGNLCCCLWVIGGGVIAAYVLQQNQAAPIAPGDGALVGLLAGIVGAFVYLVVSIPISILVAPMERMIVQRFIERMGEMPPEFREFASRGVGTAARLILGFIFWLFVGAVFSTVGGLIGQAIFQKKTPPGVIDVPPQPPPPPSA